jgi:hypothetical protein
LSRKSRFDILVLCHSVSSREAISLVSSVQRDFPEVLILALEKLRGSGAYLSSCATAVSSGDPSKMLDAVERLLGEVSGG